MTTNTAIKLNEDQILRLRLMRSCPFMVEDPIDESLKLLGFVESVAGGVHKITREGRAAFYRTKPLGEDWRWDNLGDEGFPL